MLRYGWGDDEERYFVLSFEGDWSIQDFVQALSDLATHAEASPHKLSLLIDMRHSGNPPTTILETLHKSINPKLCGIRRVTVISKRPLWKRLYQLFERVYQISHQDLLFVDNVDAAYGRLIYDAGV